MGVMKSSHRPDLLCCAPLASAAYLIPAYVACWLLDFAGDGSTKKAIARLAAGYTLPGAASAGRCSASIGDAVSVGFGYNTTSSCGIGMTRAQVSRLLKSDVCSRQHSTADYCDSELCMPLLQALQLPSASRDPSNGIITKTLPV